MVYWQRQVGKCIRVYSKSQLLHSQASTIQILNSISRMFLANFGQKNKMLLLMTAFSNQPHTTVDDIFPSEAMVSMWTPVSASYLWKCWSLNVKIYEDCNPLSFSFHSWKKKRKNAQWKVNKNIFMPTISYTNISLQKLYPFKFNSSNFPWR